MNSMLEQECAQGDETLAQDIRALLVSTGHHGWSVVVMDGLVELTAPPGSRRRSIAALLARSVPGVVEVHVS